MAISEQTKGHIVILLTNIIFGINTPIAKDALSALGPYVLSALRFAGAALLFWIASLILHTPKTDKKDIVLMCIASLPGIVFNLFCFIIGLSYTTPTNASVIVSMTPIFTMIMAWIFLKEPMSIKKIAGVACGLTGAVILILSKTSSLHAVATNNTLGITLCLVCGVSYALYLTLFAGLVKRNHPVNTMKWMFTAAFFAVFPVCYPHLKSFDVSSVNTLTFWEAGYVVLMATFVNYLFIPVAQARLRPTTLSMYNYIQPVVTAFIALLTAMETFSFYKATATLLVFAGVYIVTTSKSRRQIAEQKKVSDTLKQLTNQNTEK